MKRHSILQRSVAILSVAALIAPAWAVTPTGPQLPAPGKPGMSRADQEKLGLQAATDVYKQMPVLPDSSPITQYVQRLGGKLVKQIPPENSWPYQFHVIEQKDINAFALPGGPIFINVGTITAAANEAQLAGVMSHEMSHVYMQHTAKSMPREKVESVLGALGGLLGGGALGTLARLGVAGTGLFFLRYSREDEAQADAVGAVIMYKAGYNPVELANFFEVLSKQGGAPPQFLSDHPNPGNRTEAIEKEIRNWPPKKYLPDTQAFEDVKKQAVGVHAYSAQEIADGAKQGLWAQQNIKNGAVPPEAQETVRQAANTAAIPSVDYEQVKPDGQFTEMHRMGVSISYPANWSTAAAQNSIAIAPKAGVSQNAIAYGAIVSRVQDANADSLDRVAQDLIQSMQRSNPGLRQSAEITRTSAGGKDARSTELTGNSPLQPAGSPIPERDWLVVTQGPSGGYLYLVFIAPERDFAALRPTYQKMLDSLQLE